MGERVQWNSNFTFLMAMIGAAVGLGNIWRFPYIFYSNGQGSFLIPYLCAILILGLPFLLLEYSLGAKFNDSVLNTFSKIDKKFKVVAWAIMIVSFLIVTYYLCIVGWDLNYFVMSFTKAWGPDPDVFFNTQFLQSAGLSGITNFIPYIFVAVIILWVIVWYISHQDLNAGIGRFTSLFVPLLFILGIGIAVYNVFLPGASIGYMRFLQPNWSLLLTPTIWLAAFGQILFTLSLGITVVLSYSSHLPKGTNLTKNALIVVVANCSFELINAVGVFSILGHMSYLTGLPFEKLIIDGSGLAFAVFPDVFNLMGSAGYILGPLFFFCILIAGITTAISYIEPLADSFEDKFNFSRKKAFTILCFVGFLITCIFTTGAGNTLIKIFDEFLNNFVLIFMVILQCIIVAYFYNLDSLIEVLNQKYVFKVGNLWKYLIKYILPILLFIIWVSGFYKLFSTSFAVMIIYIIIICFITLGSVLLNYLSNKRNCNV